MYESKKNSPMLVVRRTAESTQNENELYHWKYIDKKKIKGKWRYYYPNGRTMTVNSDSPNKEFEDSAKKYGYIDSDDKFVSGSTESEKGYTDVKIKGRFSLPMGTLSKKHTATYYTNDLFNKTITYSDGEWPKSGPIKSNIYEIKKIGLIGQAYLEGKEVYKHDIKPRLQKLSSISAKTIKKGKRFLSKLFK